MSQPSNSNLIGPGQIELTPDLVRQAILLEVHFVTVTLQPQECQQLLLKLLQLGAMVYGPDWGVSIMQEIMSITDTQLSLPYKEKL